MFLLMGAAFSAEREISEVAVGGKTYRFYMKGILHYNESYGTKISRGVLAADTRTRIGGNTVVFPKGTELEFYLSGKIAIGYLASDTACRVGGRSLTFRKGSRIDFHESGKISKGYLARDCDLAVGGGTFRFKKGVDEIEVIEFYESGKVKAGFLSGDRAVRVGRNDLPLFQRIGFYENGRPEWGSLRSDATVRVGNQDVRCAGGEYHQITFHENGAVDECVLAGPQKLIAGDQKIKFDSRISFSSRGMILRGILAEGTVFRGTTLPQFKTVTIRYDRQGNVSGIDVFRHPER